MSEEQATYRAPSCQAQDCPCPRVVRDTAPCHPAAPSPDPGATAEAPTSERLAEIRSNAAAALYWIQGQRWPTEQMGHDAVSDCFDLLAEVDRLTASLSSTSLREQEVREAWIPVGERLPELNTWVALWDDTNDYLPNMAQLVLWEGEHRWMAFRTQWPLKCFSHWHELPAAPTPPAHVPAS